MRPDERRIAVLHVAEAIGGIALAAGLAALFAFDLWGGTAALAAGFAVTTFLPYALALASGRGIDLGEPIYAVSAIYLLIFPARAIYLLLQPVQMEYFSNLPYRVALQRSLASALLGYVLIVAAYHSGVAQRMGRRIPRLENRFAGSTGKRALVVYAVGFLVTAAVVVRSHRSFNSGADSFSYSGTENLSLQLTYFLLYGLVVASLVGAARLRTSRDRRGAALAALMVAGIGGTAVVYAQKTALVYALAIVALAVHYRYRRLSPATLAAAVVAFVFVVFPAVTAERSVLNEGRYPGIVGHIEAGTRGAASYLVSGGFKGYASASLGALMRRSNGVDSLALVEKYTPRVRPYQYGLTYIALPAEAYVPRALWPSKPKPLAGDFARYYMGRPSDTTNFAITNLGDLYINFSIWGIIVGALVLGVVYRLLHHVLVERTRASDAGLLLYIPLCIWIVTGVEQELMPVFSQVLKAIPILLVLVAFTCVARFRSLLPGRRQVANPAKPEHTRATA